jgi:hypothetical protein
MFLRKIGERMHRSTAVERVREPAFCRRISALLGGASSVGTLESHDRSTN